MEQLIKNGQIEELAKLVFEQKLSGNSSGTYTQVLSADQEVAMMNKLLTLSGEKADKWAQFIIKYSSCYALSNKALDVLLGRLDHVHALSILFHTIEHSGYNENLGLVLCKMMSDSKDKEFVLQVHQLLCKKARIFYPAIYHRLESFDISVRDLESFKQMSFAETYRKAISDYRKANNLERFA